MEIERKWMVKSWPVGLTEIESYEMDQGYINVYPTVRIRREAKTGGDTEYILCFKGPADPTGMAREEIETPIEEALFNDLRTKIIKKPLISKVRKTYKLSDGLKLEVNSVDEGLPSAFSYAEVEFPTQELAAAWTPESVGLGDYLNDECTGKPGSSMGAYWQATRG